MMQKLEILWRLVVVTILTFLLGVTCANLGYLFVGFLIKFLGTALTMMLPLAAASLD